MVTRFIRTVLVFAVIGPPLGMLFSLLGAGAAIQPFLVLMAGAVSYGVGVTAALIAGIAYAALNQTYETSTNGKQLGVGLGAALGAIAGCIGMLAQNLKMSLPVIPTSSGARQLLLLGILSGLVCGYVCAYRRGKAKVDNGREVV
jgi:hypothetical protein